MKISTLIEVAGTTYQYTPAQAAAQVMQALGGSAQAGDTSTARITFHGLDITTNVELEEGDTTPDADTAASQVLTALGGTQTKDHATVSVAMPGSYGNAGVPT